MMDRAIALLAAATMFAIPASGHACGACVEDKVAATYDHAVVKSANLRHQQVVFVAIDSAGSPRWRERIVSAARKVTGVEPGSVRTSIEPAAFSFALDASREPSAAVAQLRADVHDPRAQFSVIRIVRDGVLTEPK
jgi:hypothetical protein